jgi:hypothetical protein
MFHLRRLVSQSLTSINIYHLIGLGLSAVAARRALKSGTSSPKLAGSSNGNIKTEDSWVAQKLERSNLRDTEATSELQDVPKENFILQDAEVNTQAATGALTTDYSPFSS